MILDPDDSKDSVSLNLTPMIDVVFLLIIFFMVATTFVREEKEIDLDLPETPSSSPAENLPGEVVINILRDGAIKVAGRQVSAEALEGLLKQARARNPKQSALIRGDRGVKYEYVVRVVGICHEASVRTTLAALEPVGPGGG